MLGRRVQELLARLDEQGRFLAEREYVVGSLAQRSQLARRRPKPTCAPSWRRPRTAAAPRDRNDPHRARRARGAAQAVAGRARQAAARDRHDEARGREPPGRPSAWRTRCCASASTTSPPRWRGSPAALEGPGSPIDTILAADAARPAAPQRRQRRPLPAAIAPNGDGSQGHARRPHPGAAEPRLAGAAAEPRLIGR